MFKSKMKSMKEEKWENKFALHDQYPKILEEPHVDTVSTNKMVIKLSEKRNRRATSSSSRPGNKNQKPPESNMWQASEEQLQSVFTIRKDSGPYCIWMRSISINRVHLQAQQSCSVSPLEHLQRS